MGRRGRILTAGALVLAAASCGTDGGVTARSSYTQPNVASTAPAPTDAPPAPTDASTPGATDPVELPDTTMPDEEPPGPPTTVAVDADPDGIGDVLFPALGNPGIDVQDYDVVLTYDQESNAITGSVTLQITMTDDRDEFTLDSLGPIIGSVTVDGRPAEFESSDPELRITPTEPLTGGESIEVVVEYHAVPAVSGSPSGLASGWFDSEGGSYVLNEPDGARTWLPSNDHPADKATWTFEITVASGVTAVANGSLVSTTPGPDGDTWVWRQEQPMATYLIQLLTGDYEIIEGTGPEGLPLLSVVLRDDLEMMQQYVDTIPEQIDVLDDWFGPFPLDTYGIAMTDSFPGLAMETQGRSLFSRSDFQSGTLGYIEQLLLSHELTHQWFGDAVTLRSWSDIWLAESFATYGQWLWMDHIGISDLEDDANNALDTRQMSGGPATGAPTVDELFGYNSYDGGAVVLHALRRMIGDDAFFGLLQQWIADYAGTSRTSADFIELAGKVADTDLTEFFDTWLYATELPSTYPKAA